MVQQDKTVIRFERLIADYIGSKYGVAVDCCTHALFLSLLYLKHIELLHEGDVITIPRQTYHSLPNYIRHAGLKVRLMPIPWHGHYRLLDTPVYDSAVDFDSDIYVPGSLFCVSFQYRKALPIGRGGMILTDDKEAVDWLREARLNGSEGWEMYMMGEQAARGITLFEQMKKKTCYMDYKEMEDVQG